ncbi:MAG TPA: response regulator [Myxococcales bacterium]|jgi:two-component system response regulator MprA|nr:response regulator [Myxococcales bacterium]
MTRTQPSGERVAVVVEREGQARELEAHFLRDIGFQVELAADGATGWDRVQQLHPHLVVSEVLVPRMDGLALCRQIKSSPATREIPVLIVSMLAATARSRDAGADAFLLKPLSQERLAGEIARLVPEPAAARTEEGA